MPFNSFLSWLIKKRIHQIELFVKYPHDVQRETFLKLLHTARNTEWGKKFGYSEINDYETYKNRVPIQHYEDVKPYVDQLIQGSNNLLWPTDINWFAKSSGTTSDRSKFIPVSREALEDCHYKGGKDLLALYYHNNPKSKLYAGKSLVVGGSSAVNEFREDSYSGDLSAIIIKNLPLWVEFRRVPEKTIALLDNWEEKIDRMARSTMNEDVTNIAGVPSWTLVLLKHILELKGKKDIREVWPNLELFMHGGVSFKPYESQYKSIISGANMNYYQSYNASEGYFGIQDRNGADDLLLMLDYGIFYEFIPMSDWDKENPATIGLHEVELDTNYALVISTNGGLWRYQIGDTIKFTNLSPFRFVVSGRTKHFINAFGEELVIDNAEEALRRACRDTDAMITEYTAAPVYMSNTGSGGHEWLIEFCKEPASLEQFIDMLDHNLKLLNSDYEAKRTNNLSIGRPVIKPVPEGTFYNWLKEKNKLGGQNKVPRLSNDRTYLNQILEQLLVN
jgi:hypothetical protein